MRKKGRKNYVPHYPASPTKYPTVVILGRPNVGKSTLFNRLSGSNVAIVQDQPGVTRDRIYHLASIYEKTITLVDTGGWEYSPENETEAGINKQCQAALKQACLVIFTVDGRYPPTTGDYETADLLRKQNTPVILAVNKVDGQKQEAGAAEMYSLGLNEVALISAVHGRGFDVLEEMIYNYLPQTPVDQDEDQLNDNEPNDDEDQKEEFATRVAIIGRPNVGKSSLINYLLEEDRLLTMNQPGTTRDPIDTHIIYGDREYVFVDTAGMRKKSRVKKESPEQLAVSSAVNAISRCRVVVLMVDADEEAAEQDAKILGLAVDRGRAVVIALNKWDLLKRNKEKQKQTLEQLKEKLTFAPWAKVLTISALEGKGVKQLLDYIDEANAQFNQRVQTSKLNSLFENIINHHPPPMRKGRPVKLYYATQASVRPPTFVIYCNYPEAIHFSYKRYIENQIRKQFGFEGSPLKLILKKRISKGK